MPGTIVSLGKDRDGREGFRLIVPLPPDPLTGRRRQKWETVRGVSRREAERTLAKMYAKAAEFGQPTSDRLTVADYFERWLQDSAGQRVSPSSLVRYHECLALLKPYIGRVKLNALKPLDVQRAYTALRERTAPRPLSPKTILNVHRVLHNALRQALKWGLVNRNVAALVDPPRAPKYEAVMLTPEQVSRVLRAADASPFAGIYRLAPLTGMRLGEILALQWTDVDLERGRIYVRHTARRQTGKGIVIGNTKTARSERPVPLSLPAIELLQRQRDVHLDARVEPMTGAGLVFCKEDGSPLDSVYVSHCWRELTRKLGVKARFHDLRHAFATFALKGGVSVKVVSEILGHTTTAITENLYTSVLPGLKEDAAAAVAGVLADAAVREALEVAQ